MRWTACGKGEFVGREALIERQASGTTQRLVSLLVEAGDADAPPLSAVFKDGAPVGVVGSGGWGHRIGRSIALAYARSDLAEPGTRLDVAILGTRCAAIVGVSPLYDPANARLRL